MRQCFICKSESEYCGHRELEVLHALHEAEAAAFLRQVLAERHKLGVDSTQEEERATGELMRKNGNGAKS